MAKDKTDYTRWISPYEAIVELARRWASIPPDKRMYASDGNDVEQMQADNLYLAIQCERVTRALLVGPGGPRNSRDTSAPEQHEVDAKVLLRSRDWLLNGHSRENNGARVYLLRAETEKLLPDPSPVGVELFRTGAAGKPSAMDLIVGEFKRRVAAKEVMPKRGGLEVEGKHLSEWWEGERFKHSPPGPHVAPSTAQNHIRALWRTNLNRQKP
jgi:hypothetical protein